MNDQRPHNQRSQIYSAAHKWEITFACTASADPDPWVHFLAMCFSNLGNQQAQTQHLENDVGQSMLTINFHLDLDLILNLPALPCSGQAGLTAWWDTSI